MFDWLVIVPWYIWLIIFMLLAVSITIIVLIFRGGWRWRTLHFFKDKSFEFFPIDREEGKISFRPYRKGFKKGEPVEKVIVTEPCTMIHSPIAYRVYITNEDCPTTIPPPTEFTMTEIKCPNCKENVEVPNINANPEIKPTVISLSQTRGFISALRAVSERIRRGPWMVYLMIGLLCFALGAMVNFFITVSTGHYKMLIDLVMSFA